MPATTIGWTLAGASGTAFCRFPFRVAPVAESGSAGSRWAEFSYERWDR